MAHSSKSKAALAQFVQRSYPWLDQHTKIQRIDASLARPNWKSKVVPLRSAHNPPLTMNEHISNQENLLPT